MADAPMSAERFEAILDAYGADPRRWPQDERGAAESLAKADPALGAVLRRAAELDALIHLPSPAPASEALREAVIASALRRPARRRSLWWAGAGVGAALAGAAAGAVTVGVLAPRAEPGLSIDQATSASTVFSSLNEGDL